MKDDERLLTGYPPDGITGHHWCGKCAGRNSYIVPHRKMIRTNPMRAD